MADNPSAAPMAGTGTPALAAAVSNAGGLGSLGVGATNAEGARKMIAEFRALSARSLNVNVFCHQPAKLDATVESAWIERLRPEFARFGATPPTHLTEIYRSFVEDDDMLATLLQEKPKVVSFHFGVPAPDRLRALRDAGIILLASATNPNEAQAVADAGIHAVVAQGYEAGGHRGVFNPDAADGRLGTIALSRLLARQLDIPVIGAGGIMDGAGIAAVLHLGAAAAQRKFRKSSGDRSSPRCWTRTSRSGPVMRHSRRNPRLTLSVIGGPAGDMIQMGRRPQCDKEPSLNSALCARVT